MKIGEAPLAHWLSAGRMLRRTLLSLLLPILVSSSGTAFADNPANDSDSITLRIRPVIDMGVEIDTNTAELDFTMDMGATQFMTMPATITILGNVNPQELDVTAGNISASPVWDLDLDEDAGLDELQLYALFSVGRSTHPLESEFNGVKNLLTGAVKRVGTPGGNAANGNFENNVMQGGADMDGLNVGDQRQMWLRVDAPPQSSTATDQYIQVTLTATRTGM